MYCKQHKTHNIYHLQLHLNLYKSQDKLVKNKEKLINNSNNSNFSNQVWKVVQDKYILWRDAKQWMTPTHQNTKQQPNIVSKKTYWYIALHLFSGCTVFRDLCMWLYTVNCVSRTVDVPLSYLRSTVSNKHGGPALN